MTSKKFEIEIDDALIPDGYEPIAIRIPVKGENAVSALGGNMVVGVENPFFKQPPRLIIRKIVKNTIGLK